jgi:hypothetical protein
VCDHADPTKVATILTKHQTANPKIRHAIELDCAVVETPNNADACQDQVLLPNDPDTVGRLSFEQGPKSRWFRMSFMIILTHTDQGQVLCHKS